VSPGHVLLAAAASAVFGSCLALAAIRIAARWPGPQRFGRRLAHVGVFSGAAAVHLWWGFWGVVTYGLTLSFLLLCSHLLCPGGGPIAALQKTSSPPSLKTEVLVPYAATALGGVTTTLLLGDLAMVGYLVCGWGDPAGAWLGRTAGRRRILPPFRPKVGEEKTVLGSVGVFGVGAAGAFVALLGLGIPAGEALLVGSACAFSGAVAEATAPSESDNFWLPVVPTLVAGWVLGS
jgi:hypothetical protein